MNQPPNYPPPPPGWAPPPPPPPKKRTGLIWLAAASVAAFAIGGGAALLTKDSDQDQVASASTSTPAVSSPTATEAEVPDECRAWVRDEIMDDSEGIDGATGYGACGELSDGQLQAVIDEETEKIADDPEALAEATKTEAEEFQECVGRTGTASEKKAVKHVTKVTGADEHNRIADLAEVYTDFSGGMMGDHAGDGRLIASAFTSCYKSANGLVTVYDKDGELLATDRY
ncbi:hypothetical protein NC239_33620 [Streptomyces sp. G3]|uniref:hypothetical protein n=1 Tax=Streptomyces sp. G3 TaxID=690144 RepID=UPI00202EAC03|nr:hypothetical protein [Streptomyces sp. G3]MCM1943153.1 hypothetical protein [Streptomyces sp. G3]